MFMKYSDGSSEYNKISDEASPAVLPTFNIGGAFQ